MGKPFQSYGASLSPAVWDHTGERAHFNPSQTGLYSIYLPQRDGKLS